MSRNLDDRNSELDLQDECQFASELDRHQTAMAASGCIFLDAFKPLAAGTFSETAAAAALDMLAPRGPGKQMFDAACAVATGCEGDFEAFANTIRSHIRKAMTTGRCKPDGAKRSRSKGKDDEGKDDAQGDLFGGDQ